MRSFMCGLIIVLAAGASAKPMTKSCQEGVKAVNDTTTKVLTIIGSPAYQDPGKRPVERKKVLAALLEVTELDLICQLTLGAQRKAFKPDQYDAFKEQFKQLLFSTYITHLEKYTDEEITIVQATDTAKDRVKVMTRIVSSGNKIPVEYSVIKREGKWRLYDVNIEGVSLVRNYRTQFSELLRKNEPDEFIERVKEKVDKLREEWEKKLADEVKAAKK